MIPGNQFILGQEVKKSKNIAGVGHGAVVSAGLF